MYDDDGNMTGGYTPEGYALTCTYDAENRMTSASYVDSNSVTHTMTLVYSADNFIAKQTETVGTLITETRFVRDNNHNTLQERDGNNNITRSYAWDPTAPGGIGGLLELTVAGQHYNYLFDGKGNVSAVVKASDQSIAAAYSYDGFGNTIGEYRADDFAGQPYRFSTKPYYEGYGIIYYGYRFYDPIIGAWMTRDPSGENEGTNLYKALNNNSVVNVDFLGLRNENKVLAGEALIILGALKIAQSLAILGMPFILGPGASLAMTELEEAIEAAHIATLTTSAISGAVLIKYGSMIFIEGLNESEDKNCSSLKEMQRLIDANNKAMNSINRDVYNQILKEVQH